MQDHTKSTALVVSDLKVVFEGRTILQNCNLQVAQAEKVLLTGPSGCGKSTLLKCLLGLTIPQKGTITVNGQTLDRNSVWDVRRKIAYVTQQPEFAPGTVMEALQQPFNFKVNMQLCENLHRIPGLLKHFNLSANLLTKDATTLSGGEKQRIALISALLLDRPIILLDEATSALDRKNKQAVADFFQATRDKTVVAVAHDADWLDFADRIIELPASSPSEGPAP